VRPLPEDDALPRGSESVTPPRWLDELKPRAKRPCPRCGREIPVLSLPTELLKWPHHSWSQRGAR
jgi:hypothetical protein